jgi:hypothetical protein
MLLVLIALIAGLMIFNSVDQTIKNSYFELVLQKLNASLCGGRTRRDCDNDDDNNKDLADEGSGRP